MPNGIIDGNEVVQRLNFVERVRDAIGSSDEYRSAMLENQRVIASILAENSGMGAANPIDPTNIDADNLPIGLVGTTEENIASGDRGRAVFDIGGSKYEATVRANGNVSSSEAVVVVDDGNKVRGSRAAAPALASMTGAGGANGQRSIDPRNYSIYETDDQEQVPDGDTISLSPGESVPIVTTGTTDNGGELLGVGATDELGVTYKLVVDGSTEVGGETNSSIGGVNDPLWLSDSLGGVVEFDESATYYATRDESETGTVELMGRLHVREY